MPLTTLAAVLPDMPLLLMDTVAVPPESETVTLRPLPLVVTELPLVSATLLPSMDRISLLPSCRPDTVSVSRMMLWLDSIALTLAPLNTATAEPPMAKVGLLAVALVVGASLTAATATVTLLEPVPPRPSLTLTLTVRVAVLGSLLVLL